MDRFTDIAGAYSMKTARRLATCFAVLDVDCDRTRSLAREFDCALRLDAIYHPADVSLREVMRTGFLVDLDLESEGDMDILIEEACDWLADAGGDDCPDL